MVTVAISNETNILKDGGLVLNLTIGREKPAPMELWKVILCSLELLTSRHALHAKQTSFRLRFKR